MITLLKLIFCHRRKHRLLPPLLKTMFASHQYLQLQNSSLKIYNELQDQDLQAWRLIWQKEL